MPSGVRRFGDFCWFNMLTPDPAAARDFYTKLLGWNYVELPGMGHLIVVDGAQVGGLWDLHHPNTPPGTPPGITVMVRTEDIQATSDRAAALGGSGSGPRAVGPAGTMGTCTDPAGARFDLWQGAESPGTTVDSAAHGAPSWFETMTSDIGVATHFYEGLFGWKAESMPSASIPYYAFNLGGEGVAGMFAITPDMGPMPPAWFIYFTVRDLAAAERDVLAHGGTICMPRTVVGGVGTICMVQSPQGLMFYLIEYEKR